MANGTTCDDADPCTLTDACIDGVCVGSTQRDCNDHVPCTNDSCKPGVGCRIYETRPEECRTFDCVWLTDARLGPEWKPDRAKFVLITARDGNGIEIRCDPGSPTAWRRAPYYAQIMQWARDAAASQGIVIAYVGKRGTLITPDAKFPLGDIEADDQIVRELSGARVVSARVVKSGTALA